FSLVEGRGRILTNFTLLDLKIPKKKKIHAKYYSIWFLLLTQVLSLASTSPTFSCSPPPLRPAPTGLRRRGPQVHRPAPTLRSRALWARAPPSRSPEPCPAHTRPRPPGRAVGVVPSAPGRSAAARTGLLRGWQGSGGGGAGSERRRRWRRRRGEWRGAEPGAAAAWGPRSRKPRGQGRKAGPPSLRAAVLLGSGGSLPQHLVFRRPPPHPPAPAADGRRRRGAEGRRHASAAVKRPAVRSRSVSPVMSPRRQAKATYSSPGQRWQRNNNSRHHSSLMPISSFPPAPPTRGWLCQPLCPGCQGQRPTRCNTRSRTPSDKRTCTHPNYADFNMRKTYEVECTSVFGTCCEKLNGNKHLNPHIYHFVSLF
uniref:Regulatory factor X7 n=1 Tax=Urocitellus parryii TaxID=9999 RepID=A0A8D2GX00_UROPR